MACFIGLKNRISVSSVTCLKNDLHFTIFINAQTMPKFKSQPGLSENPGTEGGRPQSALKKKVIPAAESSPSVHSGVASQLFSLPQDPTNSVLSDQPQMLAPLILSQQTPPPAETLTQAHLPGYVLPDPSSHLPLTHNLNHGPHLWPIPLTFWVVSCGPIGSRKNNQGGVNQSGKSIA